MGQGLRDEDAARLRELVVPMLQLLERVADGREDAQVADGEYQRLHPEICEILNRYKGVDPICPWYNIYGWVGVTGYGVWEEQRSKLLVEPTKKVRILCGLEVVPPWSLDYFQRNDDPNDVPFRSEFLDRLPADYRDLVEGLLEKDLAFNGLDPLVGKVKTRDCAATRGSKVRLYQWSITRSTDEGQVMPRVFFTMRPGFRIVLLHGYDKGAGTNDSRQDRELRKACQFLYDFRDGAD